MMDKWRGGETRLASCHQNPRQYLVINISRLPRRPRGRLVHLCRLMDEGFHNTGNLRIKPEGCVGGFRLARSASITRCCQGERQVRSFLGAYCPGTANPSSDSITQYHTPQGCPDSCGLCCTDRVPGTRGHISGGDSVDGAVRFLGAGNELSPSAILPN